MKRSQTEKPSRDPVGMNHRHTCMIINANDSKSGSSYLYEEHEYKTVWRALTCSQSSLTDRTLAIRSVPHRSAPTRRAAVHSSRRKKPRFVPVHESYTRRLPIGSPIILDDGSGEHGPVNYLPGREPLIMRNEILGQSAETSFRYMQHW